MSHIFMHFLREHKKINKILLPKQDLFRNLLRE